MNKRFIFLLGLVAVCLFASWCFLNSKNSNKIPLPYGTWRGIILDETVEYTISQEYLEAYYPSTKGNNRLKYRIKNYKIDSKFSEIELISISKSHPQIVASGLHEPLFLTFNIENQLMKIFEGPDQIGQLKKVSE